MANIVTQTISIQISKLVKASETNAKAISDEQLMVLAENLPEVLEQLINDDRAIVEIVLENP